MPFTSKDFVLNLVSILEEWLAGQWPVLLVALAGIVLMVARRRRYPRVWLPTVLGLAGLGFGPTCFFVLGAVLASVARTTHSAAFGPGGFWFNALALGEGFVQAAALALLVVAVFRGHPWPLPQAPPPTGFPPQGAPDTSFRAERPPAEAPDTSIRPGEPA